MTLDQLIENTDAEYFSHLSCVPGLEVHCDPDVTWKISPAAAWNNCGTRVRFTADNGGQRLDEILAHYRQNGRGAGFWVSPSAQPYNLPELLKARGLRCRKYYPGMICWLADLPPIRPARLNLQLSVVEDYSMFQSAPHPAIGPLTTRIRKFSFEARRHLLSARPRRCWELIASHRGSPVGVCTLFMGQASAGLYDVAVPEQWRNQGIGRTLVRYACEFAKERGAERVTLIATNEGYRVYEHAGFREVCRIGFWYAARL